VPVLAVVFTDDWAQEIADVSGDPGYQRATVQIFDPADLTQTGNVANNWSYAYNPADAAYNGQARVVVISGGTGVGGNTNSNPTNIVTIRVQIPYAAGFGRVKRGWIIKVTDGGRNSRLEDYLLTVNSDINSSNVASLTFTATADVEADPGWS